MTTNLTKTLVVAGLFACAFAPGLTADGKYFHPWDGSRGMPVHIIPLTDEDGQSIAPQDTSAAPFSTRTTCGACHDYEAISSGWHFNAGSSTVPQGRAGEPWMWVDGAVGMQIPISQRDWPRSLKPSDVGLTPWSLTKLFGRHMPGGGRGAPVNTLDDPEARWELSGKLDVNCLACHSASPKQNMTEWTKQIARENFRWAATAASGIAEVGGMASRARESWSPHDGPNPDDKLYAVRPYVRYDLKCFDAKNATFFDIANHPSDNRCLHCHSVTKVGAKRSEMGRDVHTAAGLKCVDCHRNDIGHKIDRGLAGDNSCRGCHLGSSKYGAPKPEHKGLPPHHFEKMACTVCHSGVKLDADPAVVRTSRANSLGIFGRAQWDTKLPYIVEPVFVKNAEGIIEPRRMMWPSYWVRVKAGQLSPVPLAEVQNVSAGILDAAQQIARSVTALQGAMGDTDEYLFAGTLGFVAAGKVYQVNADGGLDLVGEAGSNAGTWVMSLNGQWTNAIPVFNPDNFKPADVKSDELALSALKGVINALQSIVPAEVRPVLIKSGKVLAVNEAGELTTLAPYSAASVETWAWFKDGKIEPLVSDFAARTVSELVGTDRMLTEEQVSLMLKKLGQDYGFISSGKLFTLGADGTLAAAAHPAAEPVSWALGHDVRPAPKAIGSESCSECHSADSKFFFSQITAVGPLKTASGAVTPMYQFEGQDAGFNRLFGISFTFRPFFKLALLSAVGATAAMFFVYIVLSMSRLANLKGIGWLDKAALVFTILGGIGLGLSGLVETAYLGRSLQGYPVLIRMSLVGLFAASMALLTILRARGHSFDCVETATVSLRMRMFFWMLLAFGIAAVSTILIAMVPLLGSHGQHICSLLHSYSSIFVAVLAIGYGIAAGRAHKV